MTTDATPREALAPEASNTAAALAPTASPADGGPCGPPTAPPASGAPRRRRRVGWFALGGLLLLGAGALAVSWLMPLQAAQDTDVTHTVSESFDAVRITSDVASVTVREADVRQPTLRYTEVSRRPATLTHAVKDGTLSVTLEHDRTVSVGTAQLTLEMPRSHAAVGLIVDAQVGDVRVDGPFTDLRAGVQTGTVTATLTAQARSVQLSSSVGNVIVDAGQGTYRIEARSDIGDTAVHRTSDPGAQAVLTARTGVGSVTVA